MRGRILLAAVLAVLAAAGQARAQVVTGVVIDAGTSQPLRDVGLRLRSSSGQFVAQALSDSAGHFVLQAPRLGSFSLVAELIGMQPVTTPAVDVQLGSVEVTVRMAESAVPLEPLTVHARSSADLGFLRGYYERMEWNERTGSGRFITRDQVEARNPGNISDMLREVPRLNVQLDQRRGAYITVRGGRADCPPAVFVDGIRTNRRERAYIDELLRPMDLEGVEIYAGLAQMPGIYHDDGGCGVLLFWTRRGTDEKGGRPITWSRILAGAGALVILLLISR